MWFAVLEVANISEVEKSVASTTLQTAFKTGGAPNWLRAIARSVSSAQSNSLNPGSVLRYGERRTAASSVRLPPNNTHSTVVLEPIWGAILGTSSLHEGGIQVAMADGSSRFISENIDYTLYKNLSTIADGNVVGEF